MAATVGARIRWSGLTDSSAHATMLRKIMGGAGKKTLSWLAAQERRG